jgi:mRNA interferase RelE/StbE
VTWRVVWTRRAQRDLDHLDQTIADRVGRAITRLAETEQGDVKRLLGYENEWRLRVGDWRVRLTFDYPTESIEVLRVLPRGSAYRD